MACFSSFFLLRFLFWCISTNPYPHCVLTRSYGILLHPAILNISALDELIESCIFIPFGRFFVIGFEYYLDSRYN